MIRRLEPSLAVAANVQSRFSRNPLRDVNCEFDTIMAESTGGKGAINGRATIATQNTVISRQ